MDHNGPQEVVHTERSVHWFGSTKLGKQIFMIPKWLCYEESQDKPFSIVYYALFRRTRFDDCSCLFLNTNFHNDSIRTATAIVAFDSLQSERVATTRIMNLAVATIWPSECVLPDLRFKSSNFCTWFSMCARFSHSWKASRNVLFTPFSLTPLYRHTYVQRVLL